MYKAVPATMPPPRTAAMIANMDLSLRTEAGWAQVNRG